MNDRERHKLLGKSLMYLESGNNTSQYFTWVSMGKKRPNQNFSKLVDVPRGRELRMGVCQISVAVFTREEAVNILGIISSACFSMATRKQRASTPGAASMAATHRPALLPHITPRTGVTRMSTFTGPRSRQSLHHDPVVWPSDVLGGRPENHGCPPRGVVF